MSAQPRRRPRRRSVKPPIRYQQATQTSAVEQRRLRVALANSKVVKTRKAHIEVPPMKVFHPTVEEFRHPMRYFRSIEAEARNYGVVKVVPPKGWNPPVAMSPQSELGRRFETKRQAVNRLQEGQPFPTGQEYTLREYYEMAHRVVRSKFPQFAHDRVRNPTDDDVLKWARVPQSLAGVELPEVPPDPAPASTSPDASFASGAELLHAIESEYWRLVETAPYPLQVEYGSDIGSQAHMSGFPHTRLNSHGDVRDAQDAFIAQKCAAAADVPVDFESDEYYKQCGWNLHNLPFANGSLLRHVPHVINGINVPWLYIGMLFASFAWHVEDNYLLSISYLHAGSPKVWYGSPATSASDLERTMKSQVHARFVETPDLLYHLVTIISPNVLKDSGVDVYRGVQNPGEFMVTFPRSYHAGFSTGFNVGEAVNFALPSWLHMGRLCAERYRRFVRSSVLSLEHLVCRLARHGEERSIDECDILEEELHLIRKEQRELRDHVRDEGVLATAYLGRHGMDRFDCCICRHSCQLAAVVCNCSKERVACLRHFSQLCHCPNSAKCFVSYCRLTTLDALIERVARRRGKLQRRLARADAHLQSNKKRQQRHDDAGAGAGGGGHQSTDVKVEGSAAGYAPHNTKRQRSGSACSTPGANSKGGHGAGLAAVSVDDVSGFTIFSADDEGKLRDDSEYHLAKQAVENEVTPVSPYAPPASDSPSAQRHPWRASLVVSNRAGIVWRGQQRESRRRRRRELTEAMGMPPHARVPHAHGVSLTMLPAHCPSDEDGSSTTAHAEPASPGAARPGAGGPRCDLCGHEGQGAQLAPGQSWRCDRCTLFVSDQLEKARQMLAAK